MLSLPVVQAAAQTPNGAGTTAPADAPAIPDVAASGAPDQGIPGAVAPTSADQGAGSAETPETAGAGPSAGPSAGLSTGPAAAPANPSIAPAAAQGEAPLPTAPAAPGVTASADSFGFLPADDAQIVPPLGGGSPLLTPQGFGGVRVGDLRGAVAQALTAPETLAPYTGPAFIITPALALTQEYTDAGSYSGGGRPQAGFITNVQPSIAVQGETRRLQINLSYAPSAYIFDNGGGQDYVAQNFSGRALVTLIPQTLFVDLRAFGSVQDVFGGYGPGAAVATPTSGIQQDYSFSVSPYLVHRFGSFGTGELGVAYARTLQNSVDTPSGIATLTPFGLQPQSLTNDFADQDLTTENVHAAFETGEDFGRYNATVLATASDYSGGGVLDDAHRDVFSIDNGYAITRSVTALALVGYEDIRYGGTDPLHINDGIWNVGVRLRPGPDSTITARYGHQDGFDSVLLDAALSPTPRTRVYISYSAGLSTEGETLQNALANADIDSLGDPVDHTTGAPLYFTNDFFGAENNLYRLRQFTASGAWLLDRDTFTLEVDHSSYDLVSSGGIGTGFGSNSGSDVSLSWSHEFTPRLQGTAYVQYGVRSFSAVAPNQAGLLATPGGNAPEIAASATAAYLIGPSLTGSLQYSYQRTSQTGGGISQSQNAIILSLVKTF
jgi:uncharacterized protein (PEP-CTERM system associated)